MATRFIEGVDPSSAQTISQAVEALADLVGPHQVPLVFDQDTGVLNTWDKVNDALRPIVSTTGTQTLTNKTLTAPVITDALITTTPIPGVATSLAITAALHAGKTILMNQAAGTAYQLPLATGTGNKYRFVVSVASNANVISAVVATDDFYGGYIQNDTGDSGAATADFMEAGATSNTYSPTTLGGGGLIGDWVEVEDIGTALWAFSGVNKGVGDPTNRFSAV